MENSFLTRSLISIKASQAASEQCPSKYKRLDMIITSTYYCFSESFRQFVNYFISHIRVLFHYVEQSSHCKKVTIYLCLSNGRNPFLGAGIILFISYIGTSISFVQ